MLVKRNRIHAIVRTVAVLKPLNGADIIYLKAVEHGFPDDETTFWQNIAQQKNDCSIPNLTLIYQIAKL